MVKAKGKSPAPRRVKYFLYRKTLYDLFGLVLRKKKMHRLNFQMMKRFEFLVFKRMVRWDVPKVRRVSSDPFRRSGITPVRTFRNGIKNINYNISSKLSRFNNNLFNLVYLKKTKSSLYYRFHGLTDLIETRRAKLGYLNWSMFYAAKPSPSVGTNKKKKRRRRRSGGGGWLRLEKKKFFIKKKKPKFLLDDYLVDISRYYGFTNIKRFRQIVTAVNSSINIRKAAVLNLEGRINILLYRLNLVSINIFTINRFVRRGRVLLNGHSCYNPFHVAKINDNISISPKAYKFVINIFKKRLINKKIWSAIPSYIEINYSILYFSLISYPAVYDLLRPGRKYPYTTFNSDIANIGFRHFVQK